jgi:hypothetical protein
MKKRAEPIVSEIDPEFYKRLCKVVKAGTFERITFENWHKGCDTTIEATCRWSALKYELEKWYGGIMGKMDFHTEAELTPYFINKKLTFLVNTTDSDGSQEFLLIPKSK